MHKLYVSLACMTMLGITGGAHAANGGTLNFTGRLANMSCAVTAGDGVVTNPGGQPSDIAVDMGTVSYTEIGTFDENKVQTATPVKLLVSCNTPTTGTTFVRMRFRGGVTDLDAGGKVLKVTGGATGVGIGLVNSNLNLVNLQEMANDNASHRIEATFGTGSGGVAIATLDFRAVYVLTGQSLSPGPANGYMPFVLDYY